MPLWSPISHLARTSSSSKFSHRRTFGLGLLPPGQKRSGATAAPRTTQPPHNRVAASSGPLAMATPYLLDLIAIDPFTSRNRTRMTRSPASLCPPVTAGSPGFECGIGDARGHVDSAERPPIRLPAIQPEVEGQPRAVPSRSHGIADTSIPMAVGVGEALGPPTGSAVNDRAARHDFVLEPRIGEARQ